MGISVNYTNYVNSPSNAPLLYRIARLLWQSVSKKTGASQAAVARFSAA
jgi:hypothetical protein